MMAAKQSVSMMHEIHDARAIQQVAHSKSSIQVTSQMYNIHPPNLIPPTHEFNGESFFLGFLVWVLISLGDIKNRRACRISQSIEIVFPNIKA